MFTYYFYLEKFCHKRYKCELNCMYVFEVAIYWAVFWDIAQSHRWFIDRMFFHCLVRVPMIKIIKKKKTKQQKIIQVEEGGRMYSFFKNNAGTRQKKWVTAMRFDMADAFKINRRNIIKSNYHAKYQCCNYLFGRFPALVLKLAHSPPIPPLFP